MGSRLTEIVVDCHDPVAQSAFWVAARGYHVVRTEEGRVEIALWQRGPPDLAGQVRQAPAAPALVFVTVPEGKAVKNRLHLDLRLVDCSHGAEVERADRPGSPAGRRGPGDPAMGAADMLDPLGERTEHACDLAAQRGEGRGPAGVVVGYLDWCAHLGCPFPARAAAADVGGAGGPVPGGGSLPGDGDGDVDAEHPGEDGGGQVGGELEQRGGAGLTGADTQLAEPLGELLGADGPAGLASGGTARARCPGRRWRRVAGGLRPAAGPRRRGARGRTTGLRPSRIRTCSSMVWTWPRVSWLIVAGHLGIEQDEQPGDAVFGFERAVVQQLARSDDLATAHRHYAGSGSPISRSSHKISERVTASTTASRGWFSFAPLKWRALTRVIGDLRHSSMDAAGASVGCEPVPL